MTLTLLQDNGYVETINCKLFVRILTTVFRHWMIATYIKKIKYSILCVSSGYTRDICFFPVLHLNVSHLSVCCSCLVVIFSSSQRASLMLPSLFLSWLIFLEMCFHGLNLHGWLLFSSLTEICILELLKAVFQYVKFFIGP